MSGQPAAVAIEMELGQPARRHVQNLPARADVPEPEHPIPAAAGQHVAAGMKRDHQAVVAVSLERDRLAAGVHVPDPDRVVLEAGRQQVRSSGVPGEVKDVRRD